MTEPVTHHFVGLSGICSRCDQWSTMLQALYGETYEVLDPEFANCPPSDRFVAVRALEAIRDCPGNGDARPRQLAREALEEIGVTGE